jgi:uncharacterized protein with GYD domain
VKYYLVQISYTAESWRQQIASTRDHFQRLVAVRALIARLGGSLAQYQFFQPGQGAAEGGEPHTINCKFVSVAKDDLITILAMPDDDAAFAFSMAVSAEAGIRDICMTPIIPLGHAVQIMAKAHDAREQTQYSAPGGASQTWLGPPTGGGSGTAGAATGRSTRRRAVSPRRPRRSSD